jgi:hypothetical protein
MADSITPPSELVQQWCEQLFGCPDEPEISAYELVRLAAQYGADQELEACCEWVSQWRCLVGGSRPEVGLRAARRPKLPSLKERSLQLLETYNTSGVMLTAVQADTIRRALEALPDD